jgi:anti-sigma regulatory factor (Ser/Thr protein kinase)
MTDRLACAAELANLPALLDMVAAVCERERIDRATRHDLRIIAEEACVNVMRHAYPAGQKGDLALAIRVASRLGRRRVVLTLEDRGKPFDPLSAAPANTAAALSEREPGGLGVHLIRRLSDRQHYAHHPLHGNVFVIEKYLAPPAPR